MKNLRIVFVTAAAVFFAAVGTRAQVSINTDGSSPHSSAMLEVKSTSKGLLIPRMTTAQRTTLGAIATAGLMVYDTDLNKFYYHNGSGWLEGTTGGYWTRSGSTMYPTTTTDYVGIGTTTPGKPLEVYGGSRPLRLNTTSPGVGIEFMGSNATDWGIMTWGNNIRFITSVDNFANVSDEYFFDQNEFTPWTTGTKTVGSSSKRFSKMYAVDGDFSGSVGIGTSTPARTLEVKSSDWRSARISATTSGAGLELVGTATTDWAITNWNNSLYLETSEDDFLSRSTAYFFSKTTFYPWIDNTIILGASSRRWSTVYGIDANYTGAAAIGTASYLGNLHVHEGTGSLAKIYITPSATGSGDSSMLYFAEDNDGSYGMFWLYDGGGNNMELYGQSLSTTYGPHLVINRTTGNASFGNVAASGYRLSVDGKIICEEVRVNMSEDWPDYVFHKDYSLLPAEKLGQYIEENGHLPNIPPASEIEKSGLEVGQMQRLMMEKIEELSLYIIDQQKQIRELKETIDELTKK